MLIYDIVTIVQYRAVFYVLFGGKCMIKLKVEFGMFHKNDIKKNVRE